MGNKTFDQSLTTPFVSGEIHSTYSEISPVDLKNNAVNVPSSSVDSSITRDWQQQIQTKSSSPVNENDEKAKGGVLKLFVTFLVFGSNLRKPMCIIFAIKFVLTSHFLASSFFNSKGT